MSFTEDEIQAVWELAKIVPNNNSNSFRKDRCDAWISRIQYGNRDSQYGWEIDHIVPKDQGGTDYLSNLQPLQWENNLAKSDGKMECAVTADGTNNIKL